MGTFDFAIERQPKQAFRGRAAIKHELDLPDGAIEFAKCFATLLAQ
ncbi:hypothetical protein GCM10023219_19840 [Stakelama sediminis]